MPPLDKVTDSAPSTTLMKERLPSAAVDTRQWPASEVEPVLTPWARLSRYPKARQLEIR